MPTDNRKALVRAYEAATAKVAALEARLAEREDEAAILTAEIAADSEQIAAADARGDSVTALVAERDRRLRRQRDLATVRPLLGQQVAEARAEMFLTRGQLVHSERDLTRSAVTADARTFVAGLHAYLEATAPQRAAVQAGLQALAALDEEADRYAGRKHTRGPRSADAVERDVPFLPHYLYVLDRWAAGEPAVIATPPAAPRPAPAPGSIEERMLQAGVR